jgi:Flp pilus assembly protein TadD
VNVQILNPLTAPKDPYEAWRWAEDLFAERDYYGAAKMLRTMLDEADADQPYLGQVRELLARSYYHSAQVTKAVEAAREALEHEPANGYLVLLLSRALERAGQAEEAQTYRRMADALGVDHG